MPALVNLVVELNERPALARVDARELAAYLPGITIDSAAPADERTLAWIDETFGGSWSSEAFAGLNVIARRAGAPVGFATILPAGLRFAWLCGLARQRDVGIFGPIGVAPQERKTGLGRALLQHALASLAERGYARALIPAVGDERLVRYYAEVAGAIVAERFEKAALLGSPARTVVMASGNGTNFQALLDAARSGALPLDITAVVCNNPSAYVVERARDAGIAVRSIAWDRTAEDRGAFDLRLLAAVAAENPELVVLLGWMHLLAKPFVESFAELLNLHPAFLPLDPERDDVVLPDGTRMPAFRGPRAVHDALATSSGWVGATVHRVTRGDRSRTRPGSQAAAGEEGRSRGGADGTRSRDRTPACSGGRHALALREKITRF